MKSFILGEYQGLSVKVPLSTEVQSSEMEEAINLLRKELDDEEEPLVNELAPKIKEEIAKNKERLIPYAKMDAVISAIAQTSEYEFDDAEITELAGTLCENFIAEVEGQGVSIQEYMSTRDTDPARFLADCRVEASRRLLTEAVLNAVAQEENITVSADERAKNAEKGEFDTETQVRAKTLAYLLHCNTFDIDE